MIGWLQGTIIDKQTPGKLVINVNGVGYDVETSLQSFFQLETLPQPVALHIHTVVREDALLLYGFADRTERSLFRALIKVNGVGPKLAMSVLSSVVPAEFVQMITQQNTLALTGLPGIGKKTAERLVIEMKDSVRQLFPGNDGQSLSLLNPKLRNADEAINALEALGYKPQEANKVVNRLDDGTKTCEQLIRQALQILAKV